MDLIVKPGKALALAVAALVFIGTLVAPVHAQAPTVAIPQSGVPQIMAIEGNFIRIAYNNEGYVIIGYQLANRSIGSEWILLETGMTLVGNTPNEKLTRAAISLETPDGKTLPLPTTPEYRAGDTIGLQNRAKVIRDSINYFPPGASRACAMTFFTDLNQRVMSRDELELSAQTACLGRLYFHIPGGIKYGQHWLNVKLEKSVIRVPFKILTEQEEKTLDKNFKDIRQQVRDAFSPKKK